MKRISILLLLVLFCVSVIAQDEVTVSELALENDYSERIENMLEPIVGFSVATVDLTLKYPSEGLIPFGVDFDKPASLPGLPVAKSKGVLGKEIDDQPTLPTIVLSKKIVIHLDKNTKSDVVSYTTQQLMEWLSIDVGKGDLLEIKPDLKLFQPEEEKDSSFTMFYVFIGLFLLIQIIVFVVFIKKIGAKHAMSLD